MIGQHGVVGSLHTGQGVASCTYLVLGAAGDLPPRGLPLAGLVMRSVVLGVLAVVAGVDASASVLALRGVCRPTSTVAWRFKSPQPF